MHYEAHAEEAGIVSDPRSMVGAMSKKQRKAQASKPFQSRPDLEGWRRRNELRQGSRTSPHGGKGYKRPKAGAKGREW